MTFGSRTMSAGLPSTSTLPRSSTMARSTSGITISMTCSTISTVTPVARTFRTSSTPVCASIGVRPVRTSSSKSSFGSVASARATSSRRFSEGINSLARTSARLAHDGGADQRADDDVVDDSHGLEALDDLERARDAALATLRRRQRGDVLAVEPDRSLRRRQHARDQIEQRRLAGAIGANQANDLAAPDRYRDVAVGDQPAEALPDAFGFQQERHRAIPLRRRENNPTRPSGRASEISTIKVP